MSNLLEQAIIDAKQLREAAMKNAENLILEKYADTIKDAAYKLLSEQEDELLGGEGLEGEETDEAELGAGLPDVPLAAIVDEEPMETEEVIELDLDDLKMAMELDDAMELESAKEDLDSALSDAQEAADEMLAVSGDEEEIDISDLEIEDEEEIDIPGVEMDLAPEAPEEFEFDSKRDEEEDEDEEEEILSEEIIDQVVEALTVDYDIVPPGMLKLTGYSEPETNVEVQMAMIKALQDTDVAEQTKELQDTIGKLEENNLYLKDTVKEIGQRLIESNILNARLLYTNRVLKSDSLNERQKQTIAESISKSRSVEEAKTIYETLIQSMSSAESQQAKSRTLNEVVEKKSKMVLSRRKPKTASNSYADRMKILAGITKRNR